MEKSEQAGRRIAHIKSHLEHGFDVPQCVHNVETNSGSVTASLMELSSHSEASAMAAWFVDQDLAAMRQWCYVAARLDQKRYQLESDTLSPGAKMLQLFLPLLSNDDALVQWFAHCDWLYDPKRFLSPTTHDFWAWQAVLAIRGDWKDLEARCRQVIASPPKSSGEQKYLIDHHFYLALATGDQPGMETVLRQLVTPALLRSRSKDESGFTEDLVSKPAVIYAKLAWRSGYKIQVDSPYVPAAWLPMEPLLRYESRYAFLSSS